MTKEVISIEWFSTVLCWVHEKLITATEMVQALTWLESQGFNVVRSVICVPLEGGFSA